ncbi:hypothetical protein SCHPADRAFT_936568 [Schizopora paradoxa]|uniref:Uncharacterized protein n=1 Tax=Schizopora paradoxa TaxID=27342 RepID=A0A0H2S262_9AGAM|nr:hypothetical protein SCHPADRAFT_936568 [Schizopora paradoxa]
MMDRYLAVETPEAQAYTNVTENVHWDTDPTDHPHDLTHTLPASAEANIALSASYMAFLRYVAGEDLYVPPRTLHDLRLALTRYAHDAIHNIVARSRMPLADGGYRRVCARAERSVRAVLRDGENVRSLLGMHAGGAGLEGYGQGEMRVLPAVATT